MTPADQRAFTTTAPQFDSSDCAKEPIHLPGAIQPHGALIAILVATGRITHASVNLAVHVGVAAGDALGQPASSLFGEQTGRALLDAGQGASASAALLTAAARTVRRCTCTPSAPANTSASTSSRSVPCARRNR